jgi:dihydrofolate synthase/folylpolyglutamate synthase
LLFGCAADKDAAAMAKIACPRFSKIIITTPGTFKISNPAKVYEAFAKTAEQEKIQLVLDTREAVRQALEFAHNNNQPVLGTGSFYLVSEIRKFVCS